MKEKLIIFSLIFSLTINVAALITMGYFWGKDYTSKKEISTADGSSPLISGLSLDTRQRGKMQKLRQSFQEETSPMRNSLITKREELVTLLNAEKLDRSAIGQKLKEINEVQYQIQEAVVDNLLEEKTYLNPRQQKRYGEFICSELCQGRCSMEPSSGCRCGTERGKGRGRGMGMGRGEGQGRWQ
jgi:Spy/CpxP family protein refolding chaperone